MTHQSIAELEAELRRARARRDEWEAEVARENVTVLELTKRLEIARQHQTKQEAAWAEVLDDIYARIAAIDGISTTDALNIGALIKEYGGVVAGDAMIPVIDTLFNDLNEKLTKPSRKPWEPEG